MWRMLSRSMVIILMLLGITTNLAANQWEWQYPNPQGNTLFDVEMVDGNTAYAVGSFGTIIKTTDGGATWELQESQTQASLEAVYFIDANTGWIVGQYAENSYFPVILSTQDGGQTWNNITPTTITRTEYTNFTDVYFADSQNGWVSNTNNLVLHTTDGGATWTLQTITDSYVEISDLHFFDANNGLVSASGTIYSTSDGGATWQQTNSDGPVYFQFMDGDNGWGIAGWDAMKTTDGGQTWETISLEQYDSLYNLHFVDENTGWVVGYYGLVLFTDDGGETWQDQSVELTSSIYSVDFGTSDQGMFVGTYGFIYGTGNAGREWHSVRTAEQWDLNDIYFANANTGWAIGENSQNEGVVLKTTEGGNSWSEVAANSDWDNLSEIYFLNDQVGWVAGKLSNGHGMLLSTDDGGATWTTEIGTEDGYSGFLAFQFNVDENLGWITGEEGTILSTTDGGNSWSEQSSHTSEDLEDVFFADSQTGYACGYYTMIKTTDGGATWSEISNETYFTDLNFLGTQIGWATSYYGNLYSTDDGGTTWTEHEMDADYLSKVLFLDENNGWAIGTGSRMVGHDAVFHTTDAGATWTDETDARVWSYEGFEGISFVDENHGWVAGQQAILYTDGSASTGITDESMSDHLPKTFILKQNYPNPFNPSTTIEYSLPRAAQVEVAIFDLRGNRINTLVQGRQQSGSHTIQWQGINDERQQVSAGIYLYRVQYEHQTSTRKMILLR